LVVIGIIATLVGMLLPTVARVRDAARLTQCASNLHQIVTAMNAYAAQWHGSYPSNLPSATPAVYWYDDDRIGSIIPALRPPVPATVPGGGVYVCPNDGPGVVFLSYAMNAWASTDSALHSQTPASGRPWGANVHNASQMILLSEGFSWKQVSKTLTSMTILNNPPSVGSAYATSGAPSYTQLPVTTAGQRFGGAGGIQYKAGVFGNVMSELAFYRHRTVGLRGTGAQPLGRVNIAYADGHVASKTNADLVRPSGQATGDSVLSPADLSGN
jgi:prepilin-type processing-associated H-X9-DG protein